MADQVREKRTREPKLTDHDVERLAGQTPCLCGSIAGWHPECYRGKTDAQIRAGYRIAFNKARQTLRQRIARAALKGDKP